MRRADVLIRAPLGNGRVRSPACGGRGQLGYSPGKKAIVAMVKGCDGGLETAAVIAHELGHVLGLHHEKRRCALMNPVGALYVVGTKCKRPPPGQWGCRLLQSDDLRGAVRRYGGRVRPRRERYCPIWSAPATPTALTATDAPDEVTITFTPPPAPAKLARLFDPFPPQSRVAIARGAGTCPTQQAPPVGGAVLEPGSTTTTVTLRLDKPAPGSYCFVAWTEDSFGRASGLSTPARLEVTAPPDPEPPPDGSGSEQEPGND